MPQWSDDEVRYLIQHYDEVAVKQIADELGRKPQSVYRKMRSLRLKVYRRWTDKEEEYLRESLGRVAPDMIAKELFRSVASVYNKIRQLGLSVKDPYEQSIAELARAIGAPYSFVYAAVVKDQVLHERHKSMNHFYSVDCDSLRDYVVQAHPYRTFTCLLCQQPVEGDIYCQMHLPSHLRRRPQRLKRVEVPLKPEDFQAAIGEVLQDMRQRRGLMKQDISLGLNQDESWYRKLETGQTRGLPLRNLLAACEHLDVGVKIIFEDRKHDCR